MADGGPFFSQPFFSLASEQKGRFLHSLAAGGGASGACPLGPAVPVEAQRGDGARRVLPLPSVIGGAPLLKLALRRGEGGTVK